MPAVLVMTRYRVPVGEASEFLALASDALAALRSRPGHLRGWLGRATDDPQLWTLTTEWSGVGDYRRALSSYDVKVRAVPVLSRAVDEPSAFEVLVATDDQGSGGGGLHRAADAETVPVGEASGPAVPTDLG